MPFTPEKNSSTPIDISSMPPAPTDENIVIPPPQHRDDKHEKTTPWYRKPVALIGTGALAAAMVGGGIALSGKSKNAASQPKEPGAAAPADPTASASPAESDTPSAQPEATPTPTEAPVIDEALVSELDSLNVTQFEERPLSERLTWVLARCKEINDMGYLWDFLDQEYEDGSSLSEYSPFFTPLNKDSDAETILRSLDYVEQLIIAQKEDITISGNGPLDQDAARKLVSAFTLKSDTVAHFQMNDAISKSSKAARLSDETLAGRKILKEEPSAPTQKYKATGATEQKTITYTYNDTRLVQTFVFVPREELGKGNGIWLLAAQNRY